MAGGPVARAVVLGADADAVATRVALAEASCSASRGDGGGAQQPARCGQVGRVGLLIVVHGSGLPSGDEVVDKRVADEDEVGSHEDVAE